MYKSDMLLTEKKLELTLLSSLDVTSKHEQRVKQ